MIRTRGLFALFQMPHNINFREKKSKLRKDKKPEGQGEESIGVRGRVARFRYFQDISGYSGVWLLFFMNPPANLLELTSTFTQIVTVYPEFVGCFY